MTIAIKTIVSHLTTLALCSNKKKQIKLILGLVTASGQKNLGSRTLSKTPLSTFAKHYKKGDT